MENLFLPDEVVLPVSPGTLLPFFLSPLLIPKILCILLARFVNIYIEILRPPFRCPCRIEEERFVNIYIEILRLPFRCPCRIEEVRKSITFLHHQRKDQVVHLSGIIKTSFSHNHLAEPVKIKD